MSQNLKYFTNKVIWITGASSGIGESMAYHLSKFPCKLILSSRTESKLISVKSNCGTVAQLAILPLDLEDLASLEQKTVSALGIFGEIDIVVHAGGISQRSLAQETDLKVYHQLMDVDFFGTLYLTKYLLPHFISKNSGQYVALSSTAGKIGVPVRSGYSAAKHALHGFFESLRAELSSTDISITILCPGFIKTDISKNALTKDGSSQNKMDEAQANGMPLSVFTPKALNAIAKKKPEIYIGSFKSTTLAIYVWRFFPNLLRKIIARAKVT